MYSIDFNNVSHERLQDEVIIINAANGAYYSGSGTAADLWTLISGGFGIEQATAALVLAYGADETQVRRDVEACVNILLDRGIVSGGTHVTSPVATLSLPAMQRSGWVAPSFDEYTDMWDLLQADPIHDVGEAGWPFAVPQIKA